MRARDAFRLIFPQGKGREVKIFLTPVRRNVVLRRGTSDIKCLQNVFLDLEYKTHFRTDPKVIIDAGANIGMATLFFSLHYPQAKIVAIEPEPSNFALLRQNCSALRNVTLVHAALWPTEQALVIQDSQAEKWAFSVKVGESAADLDAVKSVTVPGLLDELEIGHIDILKLDVEGAERELFNRGAESWLGAVGLIIIELHDRFVPGCAFALYSKIVQYPFVQEIEGKNIFINFQDIDVNLKSADEMHKQF